MISPKNTYTYNVNHNQNKYLRNKIEANDIELSKASFMNGKKNASRNLNDDGNSFNDTGID